MSQLVLIEHSLSGARLKIPFTPLGSLGPKHHAMIVGAHRITGKLWVAELSRKFGHRLVELEEWFEDNKKYLSQLVVVPNPGPRSNEEVARSAIAEIRAKQQDNEVKGYDLIFNNCETFADRHIEGVTDEPIDGESPKPQLSPQVKSALQAAGVVIATGAVILKKSRNRP